MQNPLFNVIFRAQNLGLTAGWQDGSWLVDEMLRILQVDAD